MTAIMHFGVTPTVDSSAPPIIDGHADPTVEHEFDANGYPAVVSGSWKHWGTGDQDTEGDTTLHVAVEIDGDISALAHDAVRRALVGRLGPGARLLDFALVTDEGWSDPTHVITFTRHYTEVFRGRAIDASSNGF